MTNQLLAGLAGVLILSAWLFVSAAWSAWREQRGQSGQTERGRGDDRIDS